MIMVRLILLAFLAFATPGAASTQNADIVVRGDVSRSEIERILTADNVDTSRLDESEVADAIGEIKRGRAPQNFWTAYRAHVQAWERLADAVEKDRSEHGGTRVETEELLKAETAIESTFDEVERIALTYGARLPTPPWAILPTI